MPDRHYRSDTEPAQHDNVVVGGSRHRPARLSLTPMERAGLSADALGLVSPLLTRDPATWELAEVQTVLSALEATPDNEAAASVRGRLLNMGGERVLRDHERSYQPVVQEVQRINEEMVAAKRRPVSDTYSRRLAKARVDRQKREAGLAAAVAEREVWRANPGDPRATLAIRAAQERAEREVEQQRPTLEDREAARVEGERTSRNNSKSSDLHHRKVALVKQLRDANVRVPEEPKELRAS